MHRLLVVFLALSGCATSGPAPPISLVDRFEAVAFGTDTPSVDDRLWKWRWPLYVQFVGSPAYNGDAVEQLSQLSKLMGQPIELDAARPNMTIEFSRRDPEEYCYVELTGSPRAYTAFIYIATDQPERHIRRCIAQETAQAMGLITDTDGRRDTVFSSAVGTDYLTEADLALFAILYDTRLRGGMTRAEAMPIVRQIVAEMEHGE